MKKTLFILGIISLLFVALGTGCFWAGWKTSGAIMSNDLSQSSIDFKLFSWCFNGLPFVDQVSQLLDHKKFIVLLQNNMEIRPSGGFMGSYAVVETTPQGISDIRIQDIYVPDGQLLGHVDPPYQIQQAFGQGWWKLRDANWDLDFSVAAEQIAWFFDQGGEQADGIIALNLNLVQQILSIVGPVKLIDFPETITSENIYPVTQRYAEENFFPGSTQKKDFLSALGKQLIVMVKNLTAKQSLELAKLVFVQLKNKDIMVWFENPEWQQIAGVRNWTGEINNLSGNFIYIVDTNLGANKANCCIDRKIEHKIDGNLNTLTINWTNNNKFTNPVKPFFWGGDYINYVRIVLPSDALVQKVFFDQDLLNKEFDLQYGLQQDRYEISNQGNHQVIGFWATIAAQTSNKAIVSWTKPTTDSIKVLRQPGIPNFTYQLYKDGTLVVDENITAEREFKF